MFIKNEIYFSVLQTIIQQFYDSNEKYAKSNKKRMDAMYDTKLSTTPWILIFI